MSSDINEKYFYLFSNCILVEGFSRSSIIDVQRGNIHFIPNALYYILRKYKKKTLGWIKEYFGDNPVIESYFEYLIKEELGVPVVSLMPFPSIDLTYNSPYLIRNAIIEVSTDSDFDVAEIFLQLSELNCEAVELRFISKININDLCVLLDNTQESSFRSIVLGIPYDSEYTIVNISKMLLQKYIRINRVHIYQSEFSKVIRNHLKEPIIIFSKQENLIADSCGNILPCYFSPCLEMVCESISYNTCLHKKVCITSNGDIKNCPSMSESYGNIKTEMLNYVIGLESFRKKWFIKKDDIEVCKDCEMRYVCHDCRAYISHPENIYSKPLKCSYNPYKGKWES